MICLLTQNAKFEIELKKAFGARNIMVQSARATKEAWLKSVYSEDITVAIVGSHCPELTQTMWFDILVGLSRRIPVIVCDEDNTISQSIPNVTWLRKPSATEVLDAFDAFGGPGVDKKQAAHSCVPIYDSQMAVHMLRKNGSLSVLVVDATGFRKIAVEYGNTAYVRLQEIFQQILLDHWGAPGCFRSSDALCRSSGQSNKYFIFLETGRSQSGLPVPGALERLADRLCIRLQKAFWEELCKDRKSRTLPSCINVIPEFSIGHVTAVNNNCVDPLETIDGLFEQGIENSKVQMTRLRTRRRELVQTLIQTDKILFPFYQGIFHLETMSKEEVQEAVRLKSIKPLSKHLYSFESLIRVRKEAAAQCIEGDTLVFMDSQSLRPDILFNMAHGSKVSVELDQACLSQAIKFFSQLPGRLMVNVLPRTLYNFGKFNNIIPKNHSIVFEVSESEAINNLEVMVETREMLGRLNLGIAADDFGKGFTSLERVIQIQPDFIKLDLGLVRNIHKDPSKQAFVTGLVEGAKSTHSKIIAEGVEYWEEALCLKEIGVTFVQGFLLHKPQSAEDILGQLGTSTFKEEDGETQDQLDPVA